MTDTEIKVAIAEACGWKWERHANGTRLRRPDGYVVNEYYAESWRVPDYCSDLNAMHEAEGKQPRSFWKKYVQALEAVIDRDHSEIELRYFINATAPQRAEAFLRTIGKWTK